MNKLPTVGYPDVRLNAEYRWLLFLVWCLSGRQPLLGSRVKVARDDQSGVIPLGDRITYPDTKKDSLTVKLNYLMFSWLSLGVRNCPTVCPDHILKAREKTLGDANPSR